MLDCLGVAIRTSFDLDGAKVEVSALGPAPPRHVLRSSRQKGWVLSRVQQQRVAYSRS